MAELPERTELKGLAHSPPRGLEVVSPHFAVVWFFLPVAVESQAREWAVVQEAVEREPAVVSHRQQQQPEVIFAMVLQPQDWQHDRIFASGDDMDVLGYQSWKELEYCMRQ
jgi:hypothetical protein